MNTETEEKAFELNYRANTSWILSMQGKNVSIAQPLVAPFGKPTGGWGVHIRIKGLQDYVNAKDATSAFKEVKEVLKKQEMEVRDVDIWMNLNIQWYQRLQKKYHLVRLSDLLAIADPTKVGQQTLNQRVRNYTPADWGNFAWDFMGISLSQDNYEWDKYFKILEHVQTMLNRDINPSIGCNECFIEFTKEIEYLRDNPIHDVKKARTWLNDFHNKVNRRIGKLQFPFESAAKKYLWI